jgi:hypothetical protein
MRLRLAATLIFLLYFVPSFSSAFFMFEPYAGYETGTQTASTKSGIAIMPEQDYGGRFSNSLLGARVGFNFLIVWAVIDANAAANGSVKMNDSSLKELSYSRSATGLTVGIDLPFLFRAWGGISNETLAVSSSLARDENTFRGTGTKIGLGFAPLPLISFNVEYIQRNFTEFDGYVKKYYGLNFDKTFNDAKQGSTLISVSVPFTL